jgi:hypothetical protein
MMMRGAPMCERPCLNRFRLAEARQRQRQNPHGRTVARVARRKRALDGAVHYVAADAAPAGVANVDGAALEPGREFLANVAQVEPAAAYQRAAERQRHFGVVGHRPAQSRSQPRQRSPGARHIGGNRGWSVRPWRSAS